MKKIILSTLLCSSLLVANTLDLGKVEITSTTFDTTEEDATFANEIYTKEDIKKSKSNTLYDFLNTQTSINVMPGFGNTQTQYLDMHGFGIENGYQNIVVTINGRRLNNIDKQPQFLSSISLDSIEKIEIIKGGGSVEFGDGAQAGVINIQTDGKFQNQIRTYFGNYGTKYGSLSLGYNTDQIILNAMIDYKSTDGLKNEDSNGKTDASYNRNKLFEIIYFPNDDLELSLSRSLSNSHVFYPASVSLDEYNNDIFISKALTGQTFSSYVTNVGLDYNFTNKWNMEFNYSDENKLSAFDGGNPTHYDYNSGNLKLKFHNDQLKFFIGYDQFDGDRISSTNITSKKNKGIFSNLEYQFNEKLKISAGTRYEEIEYSYNPNSGTTLNDNEKLNAFDIGINYKVNEQQSLFANYNKSFQSPDLDRFFASTWTEVSPGIWVPTTTFNDFIEPSQAKTITLGFNDFRDQNKFKISVFRTNLTNEIYYYKTGPWSGSNTNLDKSHKYGFEIFDRYQINDNYHATFNYNYIVAKIDNENESNGDYNGKDLPGVSKHNITIGFGFDFGKFSGELNHTYRSKAYALEDLSNSFEQKQEAYNSTDLALNYKINDTFDIFGKVQNLFDETNGLWLRDDVIYPVNYARTYYVGINAKF